MQIALPNIRSLKRKSATNKSKNNSHCLNPVSVLAISPWLLLLLLGFEAMKAFLSCGRRNLVVDALSFSLGRRKHSRRFATAGFLRRRFENDISPSSCKPRAAGPFGSLLHRPFASSIGRWKHQSSNGETASSQPTEAAGTRMPMPLAFSSSSWEASDFAVHVAISPEEVPVPVLSAIDKALKLRQSQQKDKDNVNEPTYSAQELLALGATWYLPSEDMNNIYKKPSRLTTEQADCLLKAGDYLRIHQNPRRFPAVEQYDWTIGEGSSNSNRSDNSLHLPKVLMEYNESMGYLVLNKPRECIPVHPTVDNCLENIAASLRRANPFTYVAAPQRLDQNTSGLITLATSKQFSAYYAKLLRRKTAQEVPTKGKENKMRDDVTDNTGIRKRYRCLVCLMPPASEKSTSEMWSVDKAVLELQSNVKEGKVLRHFLEPSVRAPKRFVAAPPPPPPCDSIPDENDNPAQWAECLMRIQRVGDLCTLRGNEPSQNLAKALWNSSTTNEIMPPSCQAVVELEVELLTGRTHQIRGQLSEEGYPLVGDVPYGGALAAPHCENGQSNKYSTQLALQCFHLEFIDPDVQITETKNKRGNIKVQTKMVPSKPPRWNSFHLETAWWTPFLKKYQEDMKQLSDEQITTALAAAAALDVGLLDGPAEEKQKQAPTPVDLNPQGLPPQAMISPGRHKYVLVKAIDPNTLGIYKWFVKSASVQECGPYHRDVARDLCEWIEACGYRAVVTGGGRILYQPETKRALVYGFR
jgi:23S rRNA-/tRNA-specific pseudouridylate synthase